MSNHTNWVIQIKAYYLHQDVSRLTENANENQTSRLCNIEKICEVFEAIAPN